MSRFGKREQGDASLGSLFTCRPKKCGYAPKERWSCIACAGKQTEKYIINHIDVR
jgi:hypothetical protein